MTHLVCIELLDTADMMLYMWMHASHNRKKSVKYIHPVVCMHAIWCIYEKMVIGIKKVHFALLCYASQLNNWAHQRKMGLNCAVGLVLVLSVDTVSYNLTWQHTTSKVYMNSALAMGLGGPSGSKEKCDLQSRLTPPAPTYHAPAWLASSFPVPYRHHNTVVTIKTTPKESVTYGICWLLNRSRHSFKTFKLDDSTAGLQVKARMLNNICANETRKMPFDESPWGSCRKCESVSICLGMIVQQSTISIFGLTSWTMGTLAIFEDTLLWKEIWSGNADCFMAPSVKPMQS